MGQVLAFKRPDKDYPLPNEEGPETDIRRLRFPSYRDFDVSAIDAGKRFCRIFEGPICSRLRLVRRRNHMNLVQLLIGQRLAENIHDAEVFIKDLLGKALYLSPTHKRYAVLNRASRKDAYSIEYFSF